MEVVARFHHRLVQIHPFNNGNGRLGRVAADMLSVALGGSPLSWGSHLDLETVALREAYLKALHAADDGDVGRHAPAQGRPHPTLRESSVRMGIGAVLSAGASIMVGARRDTP